MLCYSCGSHVQSGLTACPACGQPLERDQRDRPRTLGRIQAVERHPGDTVAERYQVVDVLASAEVGVVYRALDTTSNEAVALQIVHAKLIQTEDDRAAFGQACEKAHRLKHENCVPILDHGFTQDLEAYLAMPLLEGLSLRRIIDIRKGRSEVFSPEEVTPILEQLALGLSAAHQHMIHGSLDPSNIIVLPDVLQISDFALLTGLPRKPFLAVKKQREEAFRYMAPEVRLEVEDLGPQADLYSMGVLAAEMLTGVLYDEKRPETLREALSERLSAQAGILVWEALARAPRDRLDGPLRFVHDLQDASFGPETGEAEPEVLHAIDLHQQEVSVEEGMIEEAETVQATQERVAKVEGAEEETEAAIDAMDAFDALEEISHSSIELLEDPGSPGVPPDQDSIPAEILIAVTPPPVPSEVSVGGALPGTAQRPRPLRCPPSPSRAEALVLEDRSEGRLEDRSARASAALAATPTVSGRRRSPTKSRPAHAPRKARPMTRPRLTALPGPTKTERPSFRGLAVALLVFGLLMMGGLIAMQQYYAHQLALARLEASKGSVSSAKPEEETTAAAKVPVSKLARAIEAKRAASAQRAQEVRRKKEERAEARRIEEAKKRAQAKLIEARKQAALRQAEAETMAAAKREAELAAKAEARRRVELAAAQKAEADRRRAQKKAEQDAMLAKAGKRAIVAGTRMNSASQAGLSTTSNQNANGPNPSVSESPAAMQTSLLTQGEATCPRGMTKVDGGSFRLGTEQSDPERNFGDQAARSATVDAFCIDYYEYPNGRGRLPVSGVTWATANARCEKKGKRLCTETEWERACKGQSNFRYPYGDAFEEGRCNTKDTNGAEREVVGSGTFRTCRSRFNVFDMGGNVVEWTSTAKGNSYVVKGGGATRPGYDSRCSARKAHVPASARSDVGFRCCADLGGP